MKPYGYGVIGKEGSFPDNSLTHEYKDCAQELADEANEQTDQFYVNRRPWVVVPLFYGEPDK